MLQLFRPAFFGSQLLQVEIQVSILEIEHALARSTQPSAGTSCSIGNQDSHLGVTPVNVMRGRKQPTCGIRLTWSYHVFLFPSRNMTKLTHQLPGIDDVIANGQIGTNGKIRNTHMQQG